MSDNHTIEELQRQLDEEKAKNEQLEFKMQYQDKITGLPNRKYMEKLLADGTIVCDKPDFTVVYLQIENLKTINEKEGNDVGDGILTKVAAELNQAFGETASCFKLMGTRFCVLNKMTADELNESVTKLEAAFAEIKKEHGILELITGKSRLENHEDGNLEVLLHEAEYDLCMKVAERDTAGNEIFGSRTRKTILMIDDSPVQLRTQQAILKEDYDVLMSTLGMEGFEIAKMKQPDLILLDYDMPIVDGKRILELLKRSSATMHIPVVFVTGISEKNKFLEVATMGPAGYLLKPVSKEDLLRVVDSVFNK